MLVAEPGFRVRFPVKQRYRDTACKERPSVFFSVYEYGETGTSLVHYIYNNQFEGEYLLPEFRHLDFLWLLKGDNVQDSYIHYLQQSIKNIPGVQLITELEKEKIKNKMHLVF